MPAALTLSVTLGALTAVALWERLRPRRRWRFPVWPRRLANLGFWLANTTAAALVFTLPDQLRTPWRLPSWLSLLAGFVLLDGLIYAVHRSYHAVPLLWRLHALHHSDPDVDWSTAVRHHPLEYLSAAAVYWLAILGLGVPGPVVAAHALVVFAAAAATHGNLRWPVWLEQILQPAMITLDQHLLHHSADPQYLNCNFGAVLNLFDRVCGTWRQPPDHHPAGRHPAGRHPADRHPAGRQALGEPALGLRELDPGEAGNPLQMLLTPLRIGQMHTATHPLPDGRRIEVSAERRGDVLRLRANLASGQLIAAAHRRDYAHNPDRWVRDVAEFTAEFEAVAGVAATAPLFPADLKLKSPFARLTTGRRRRG